MTTDLMHEDRLLTYQEAALCYGMTYSTVRHYACRGQIEVMYNAAGKRPRISHAAMRAYERSLKKTGRPRRAQIAEQP